MSGATWRGGEADRMALDRRAWLAAAGSAALGAGLATSRATAEPDAKKAGAPRVDGHLHCFAGAESKDFPYHERAPYRPPEVSSPELLLKCMDDGDVDYAIVVHPEPYQDDHRYLARCLKVGAGRLKGTILVFADQPDSVAQLPKLARELPVVAARVHAYAPERLPPFGKPELAALWKLAGKHGLAMQLHFEPRYAEGFEPLVREFRDVTVIVDHLGRPLQGTPEEHDRVIAWSKFPNVYMKLSSLPTAEKYPHRQIGPVVRRLAEAYGAERMIYGGGFGPGATGESYQQAFADARRYVAHLPESDQAQIFGGTAAKLFRLGKS